MAKSMSVEKNANKITEKNILKWTEEDFEFYMEFTGGLFNNSTKELTEDEIENGKIQFDNLLKTKNGL